MEHIKTDYKSIDEYIEAFSGDAKDMLVALRLLVHESVPEINEKISWQMPTFYKSGIVIQFAAHQKHIGVYPGPDAIEVFKEEIEENGLKWTKGGFQIPFGKPIPIELLRGVVLFRDAEEQRRTLEKAKKEKKEGIKMNIITVKGMTCEHCKKAVKEALEELGLENVEVDLKDGTVTFDKSDIDMQILRHAIDEAGFYMG